MDAKGPLLPRPREERTPISVRLPVFPALVNRLLPRFPPTPHQEYRGGGGGEGLS